MTSVMTTEAEVSASVEKYYPEAGGSTFPEKSGTRTYLPG
jgi:hypothetical protein